MDNNTKPHVTQLLDLLNKPALLKWANKIGLKGILLDDYRSEAFAKGKNLHKQLEEYFKYSVPLENPELQFGIQKFMADKEILSIEKDIETENYVGRYDIELLCKTNNTKYIGDFKSDSNIYIENILQLTAYRVAMPDHDIAIIEIPSLKFKPIKIKSYKPYEEIINALIIIWNNKKLID